MEAFTAGQECTAVLVSVLLVMLGGVSIKRKRQQVYRQKKGLWYVPSNISEQRMLLDESEASRPYSLCWGMLIPGSSGLLKDQLRKDALIMLTPT